LFPVLIALLLLGSFARPWNALALSAGVALGAGLGTYGLRFTKFEETPTGLFYTPHSHFGIALSLLFLARIAYRAIQFYLSAVPVTGPPTYVAHSPVTLLLFGTLAGYYVMYAIGLLRWRRRIKPGRISSQAA
jgi:cytochrome b561